MATAAATKTNKEEEEEPLTPASRLFLRKEMDIIIHCAFGLQNEIDVESIKSEIQNSLMTKHPRFCSLLIKPTKNREHWRRLPRIDIDRHVIIVDHPTADADHHRDHEQVVNDYMAELSVSRPLGTDKPLWEVHVLKEQRSVVLRLHHALGDGVSLMSMFLACFRTSGGELPAAGGGGRRSGGAGRSSWWGLALGVLKMVWFSLVFCFGFVLRSLYVHDRRTAVSGGDGVELWPRKVVTAKFLIDDMKVVKNAIANATINDVLFGIISAGLSRYLDHRSPPNSLKEGLQITGVAMVNLREERGIQEVSEMIKRSSFGSKWGNKFGMMLLPVYYHKYDDDPLQYVKKAKVMIDRKKQSLEAHFSYKIGDLIMSLFGSKVAYLLNYRIVCNTTFTISNVMGPKEEINIAGNPITFLRVSTSSLPQALVMHMVSYAGTADMQISVAKDIIPDPEFLAMCFQNALLEMKQAASSTNRTLAT